MSEKFIFSQEVLRLLKEEKEQKYTAIEIAEKIADKFPDECKKKLENSNNKRIKNLEDVKVQWAAEVGARINFYKDNGILVTVDSPRKLFYSENDENSEADLEYQQEASTKRKNNQPEKALYPVLVDYCATLKIKTLRIDEKKSHKKGKNYNVWLHPDLVGFKYIGADFCKAAADCLSAFPEKSYLYSFEVKDGVIKLENLREAFFQTVSNSSWANYSYLVAEGIYDDEAKEELKLLCESFKIGFIKLNKNQPYESEIVIPVPKKTIDWNMINRIAATKNEDFIKFLENIKIEHVSPTDTDWAVATKYETEDD
ncbi:MAG: hypothetical protein K5838_04365 [Elusimicrobiales bacterium]|nr:hypothetical protein [Elusimicrobiales bacterium]